MLQITLYPFSVTQVDSLLARKALRGPNALTELDGEDAAPKQASPKVSDSSQQPLQAPGGKEVKEPEEAHILPLPRSPGQLAQYTHCDTQGKPGE